MRNGEGAQDPCNEYRGFPALALALAPTFRYNIEIPLNMYPHTKQNLIIIALATAFVVVLSALQWKHAGNRPAINASLYATLHESAPLYDVLREPPGPVLPVRSQQSSSIRSALQRRKERISRLQRIPRFFGRYSTEGLTLAEIEILRQQCTTGIRDCR